jgi:hypothetical protein
LPYVKVQKPEKREWFVSVEHMLFSLPPVS